MLINRVWTLFKCFCDLPKCSHNLETPNVCECMLEGETRLVLLLCAAIKGNDPDVGITFVHIYATPLLC